MLRISIFKCFLILFGGIYAFYGVAETTSEKRVIYIYKDEGVSKKSFDALKIAFTWTSPNYRIKEISAKEVIDGKWPQSAKAFIMPGGADLYYCKKLNGKGNHEIRKFVENGGIFMGFCAGGYYGGNYVDFDRSGPLEVLGKRELNFFPAPVIGPALKKRYYYNSEKGAKIAILTWEEEASGELFNVYHNGGGYFSEASPLKDVKILSRYTNPEAKGKAAAVLCKVGKGKAILTGVHPEYSATLTHKLVKEKVDGWENLENNIPPQLENLSHIRFFQKLLAYM